MKKPALFLIIFFALSACEEVIQLDLDTAEQRIVVEANLDTEQAACKVLVSKTGDFYESNTFEKISGARIYLINSTGIFIPLSEAEAGIYSAENIALDPALSYRIQITLPENQVIESGEARIPLAVPLDTLMVEKIQGNAPGGGGPGNPPDGMAADQYLLTAKWHDPAGSDNYYRLKIFKNGEFQSATYILTDDRLGDGAPISRPVIRQTFEKGDVLRCQLLSVNKAYYDYFTDLANVAGRGFSAPTPFNPSGNLTEDVLGYFGIWQVSEQVIVVE